MKAATIIQLLLGLCIIFPPVFCTAQPPAPAQAQAQDSAESEPAEKYSREELAQMLAPIALYPDTLLTQVLMASTYPIEVIEADRWRKRNPQLKDKALDEALLDQGWDPSVKALCHFPTTLAMMSERISETTNIGNAFLAQETEVLGMIQELRARAREQGNLNTTAQQKVLVEKETIIIEPASPTVIYVPYYDPYSVYGPWWYPAYPPYYWGPPGISLGVGISYWPGLYFGFSFGNWAYFDWHRHSIYYHVHKRPRYVRHERWIKRPGAWRHAPHHRRGVAYRDKHTARKYGQHHYRSRQYRPDTRGFPPGRGPARDGRDRIDRDRPGDERARVERDRRERQRIEPEQPRREQAAPERQQQRIERERQQREQAERQLRQRIERPGQRQDQAERERQLRQRTEQERQLRERVQPERQEPPPRIDRDRQQRDRADQERQLRQRVEQEQRTREQAERGRAVQRQRPPEQRRDDVFNRVDNGRTERRSSERGQSSRQGRGGYSRGRGSWDEDMGGRQYRGRGDRGGDDRNRFRR
ncbi:MAG: DUF3300 domain-containing protein [Desulfurivibrio sp.]|nr:MAG: DUF3300 domain-containing protein [Desulfurivibrio sp.]